LHTFRRPDHESEANTLLSRKPWEDSLSQISEVSKCRPWIPSEGLADDAQLIAPLEGRGPIRIAILVQATEHSQIAKPKPFVCATDIA
jgi:hypothetical protein